MRSNNETGPKVCFFYYLFHVLCTLTNFFKLYLGLVAMSQKAQTTPDDVVWAIGTCFFKFFSCFLILTNTFRFYLRFEGTIRDRGGQ